jgi:hypothetical protein
MSRIDQNGAKPSPTLAPLTALGVSGVRGRRGTCHDWRHGTTPSRSRGSDGRVRLPRWAFLRPNASRAANVSARLGDPERTRTSRCSSDQDWLARALRADLRHRRRAPGARVLTLPRLASLPDADPDPAIIIFEKADARGVRFRSWAVESHHRAVEQARRALR